MPVIKILYISYDGMCDPLGQSQVLPYLAGLSEEGYSISLISAEKKGNFKQSMNYIKKICEKAHINWIPVPYTSFPPFAGTLLDIRRITKIGGEIIEKEKPAIVHCRSYIAALCGLSLKYKYGIRLLFDMRGLWANEKLDGNIWNIKNPLHRLTFNYFKKKERVLFQQSDGIISLTKKAWPVINEIGGATPKNQVRETIPCCTDGNHFNPDSVDQSAVNEWKKKLSISEDDFILTYLGSFSTWYLPDKMLEFFKLLCEYQPSAKFLIISHEAPDLIINIAEQLNIPVSSLIFSSSSRNEVPVLLSLTDLGICFIKPAFSKIASSPTKLGEMLCMGIPVVCNEGIGDTDEIITSLDAGSLCNPFDENSMRKAVAAFHLRPSAQRKKSIRENALLHFNLAKGINLYSRTYKKILGQE